MGEYKKPWLTFEEQADLLIVERGLVADRDDLSPTSQTLAITA